MNTMLLEFHTCENPSKFWTVAGESEIRRKMTIFYSSITIQLVNTVVLLNTVVFSTVLNTVVLLIQ